MYRDAGKSLARPGRKQARKHVRDGRDFNNIETRTATKSPAPAQGKAPKEIHVILTETLACFLPGRAKDLFAPGMCSVQILQLAATYIHYVRRLFLLTKLRGVLCEVRTESGA